MLIVVVGIGPAVGTVTMGGLGPLTGIGRGEREREREREWDRE